MERGKKLHYKIRYELGGRAKERQAYSEFIAARGMNCDVIYDKELYELLRNDNDLRDLVDLDCVGKVRVGATDKLRLNRWIINEHYVVIWSYVNGIATWYDEDGKPVITEDHTAKVA